MNFKIDEGTAAVLLRMSGEARHQCIDAMMMFVFCGEDKEPEDPTAAAAYGFMKMAEVSKASAAENGKKGGRPKKTNDGDTTEEGGDVVAVPIVGGMHVMNGSRLSVTDTSLSNVEVPDNDLPPF